MPDEKEPTWPFAVVVHPTRPTWFAVQGPDTYLVLPEGTPIRADAVALRNAFAKAYNHGFDAGRDCPTAQRAYIPGDRCRKCGRTRADGVVCMEC